MDRMQPEEVLARMIQGDDDLGPQRRQRDEPPSCEHWTGPVLLERAAYLRRMARAGEGFASDIVKDVPGYRATLWVRLRPGSAERHDRHLSVLMALEGKATLVSGGGLEKARPASHGCWTGAAIEGGAHTDLRAGDVVHLAPGTPFQILVPNEKVFSYLLLSIRAMKEDG